MVPALADEKARIVVLKRENAVTDENGPDPEARRRWSSRSFLAHR